MSNLRNTVSGAFTERLDPNTEAYQKLVKQRDANNHPLWENAAEEDAAKSTARVAVAMVDALGAAQDDTFQFDIAPLSEGGTITSAEYTPDANITGAVTNTRTLTVVGEVGGTTHATLALAAGVNPVAGAPTAFTINSAAVLAGEDLAVASTHAGTGIADPGGIVTVEFTLTA